MGLWALMILLFVFDTGLATLPRLPCICFLVGFGGYCFLETKSQVAQVNFQLAMESKMNDPELPILLSPPPKP